MPVYFDANDLPPPMSLIVFTLRNTETNERRELQRFTLLRHRPHTTGEGKPSAVMMWQTHCMDCGAGFSFTSGLSSGAFYRRCKKCRRGKQPSGWSKGPRIKHTLERYEEIDPASLF